MSWSRSDMFRGCLAISGMLLMVGASFTAIGIVMAGNGERPFFTENQSTGIIVSIFVGILCCGAGLCRYQYPWEDESMARMYIFQPAPPMTTKAAETQSTAGHYQSFA